jgi:hypothetical protein
MPTCPGGPPIEAERRLVGRLGIEPRTNRLKGGCSTTELAARAVQRPSLPGLAARVPAHGYWTTSVPVIPATTWPGKVQTNG